MSWINPCKVGAHIYDGHLGGTAYGGDPDSYFPELWDWLIKTFQVNTMLDVGCGLGYTQKFFEENGVVTLGVDGCREIVDNHILGTGKVLLHDFVENPLSSLYHVTNGLENCFDIVWSCEFVEHVEERFVKNILDAFKWCTGKVLAMTHARPGDGGYHHVNCQPAEYWIEKVESIGLTYQPKLSEYGRSVVLPETCGRCGSYFNRSGLIFTQDAVIQEIKS